MALIMLSYHDVHDKIDYIYLSLKNVNSLLLKFPCEQKYYVAAYQYDSPSRL